MYFFGFKFEIKLGHLILKERYNCFFYMVYVVRIIQRYLREGMFSAVSSVRYVQNMEVEE